MPLDTPRDLWTQINGLTTRYWALGEGAATLLLLHGLGGSVEAWHRNIAGLGAHFSVLAVDLPGCGLSQRPPRYPRDTLGLFADFVRAFLADRRAGPTILVGSSLGGAVALETALRHPGEVRSLVLVDSSGFTTSVAWPLRAASLPGIGELLTRPSREASARSLRGLMADPKVVTEEEIEVAYRLARLPGAQQTFLEMLRVYCSLLGISRREVLRIVRSLPQIAAPVLLIWGDRDPIFPLQTVSSIVTQLPHAQLTVMKGCGHVPFVEQPEEFNALIASFCDHF